MLGPTNDGASGSEASILVSLWRMVASSIVEQANASPPVFLVVSGLTLSFLSPSISEGGEAPKGAGAERRTPWPVLRSGRSLQRKGSPASDAVAGAPLGAPPRHLQSDNSAVSSVPGRASSLVSLRLVSPASSLRKGRSAQRRSPGTARVRKDSDALRPRGPHRPASAGTSLRNPRLTGPRGRFAVTASPVPSARLVPPCRAPRERPRMGQGNMNIVI